MVRRLTHEEFVDRMRGINNNIEILGEYVNNATKIKQTYEQNNLATYTIEKNINNKEFSTILTQYDDVLSKTDDVNTIKVIENQVISKYKETIEK